MCSALGIRKTTAWGRVVVAAWELPFNHVQKTLHNIVPTSISNAMANLFETNEVDAGDTVARCVAACDIALCESKLWSDLVHMIVTASYSSPGPLFCEGKCAKSYYYE